MRTDKFRNNRHEAILKHLATAGQATIDSLAQHYSVTGATIRSDLATLNAQKKLIRTPGGAIAHPHAGTVALDIRQQQHSAEKKRIGIYAATFITQGDTIALDASSTSLEVAHAILGIKELTVVTNSLAIASILRAAAPGIRVLLAGGMVDAESAATIGPDTTAFLSTIKTTSAFLGASSMSVEMGLCEQDTEQLPIKKAFAANTQRIFALADRAKWDALPFRSFAPFVNISAVVTDAAPPRPASTALKRAGIKLHIAPTS